MVDARAIIQRGYDSSGRPLRNTAMKWQVFDKANERMDHKLVIIQGAFMGSGGADASAGTHVLAGCNDVRRWNLTSTEAERYIDISDSLGDVVWERTAAQGFDPHFHNLLPNDAPLHADAAWQVGAWRAGTNGLSGGGPDRRRPSPFPTYRFQEDDMFEDSDRRLLNQILARVDGGFTAEKTRDQAERERDVAQRQKLTSLMGKQVDSIGLVLNMLKDDDSATAKDVKQLLRENRQKLLVELKDDPSTDGTPDDPSDEAIDTA